MGLYQQCIRIPFGEKDHPSPILISCLFATSYSNGMRGYLTVVFICNSLITNDVEHLVMYLLAIYMFSLGKLFSSSVHVFLLYEFLYIFWILTTFSNISLCKFLLLFSILSFCFIMVSFAVQKILV